MDNINFSFYNKFYFCGVGGVSMSAIATFLVEKNKQVAGSDKMVNNQVLSLSRLGVKTYIGHKARNVKNFNPDVLVYTNAVDLDKNREVLYAIKKGIPIVSRSKLLGEIIKGYKLSVAISGSHGKTTTTCMVTKVLKENKTNPTAFVGGNSGGINNYTSGNNDLVITEACEYKKSFLDLHSDIAVVLNIDNDHLDCYKNMEELKRAFSEFVKPSIAIVNNDDEYAKEISTQTKITYAIKNKATYRAKYIALNEHGYSFTVYKNKARQARINLSVAGYYNIYNALACYVVCDLLNVPKQTIAKGLMSFNGADRRLEYIGKRGGVNYVCDYAHHPTEIKATLGAINLKNTLIIFQPHTYSRTKILLKDFICVLSSISNLCLYKTYSARERYDRKASARFLYKSLSKKSRNNLHYASNYKQLQKVIRTNSPFIESVVFLGAGDIYDIAKKLQKM